MQCLLSSKSFVDFTRVIPIFNGYENENFTTNLLNFIGKNMPNQSPSEYFLYMIEHFKLEQLVEYVYNINRKCKNCDTANTTTDKTYNILINNIKDFFESREILENIFCDKCKTKTQFEQHRYLSVIPPLISISLNKYFDKFLLQYPWFFIINDIRYNLIGVIDHYGELNAGHYVSRVKRNNNLYLTDDKNISQLQQEIIEPLKETYMLFYERQQ
jgi:ubiquitin C-terminal hydrolase